jgi:hypothetical protein
MKSHRFKISYRKSASKLHKAVGDSLRGSPLFNGYPIYQEYPVSKVNPDYKSNREHFDWVIPGLKLVIECHGLQHYEQISFGGRNGSESLENIQQRDDEKKMAAISAGYIYLVIKYTDEKTITAEEIWRRIQTLKDCVEDLRESMLQTSGPAGGENLYISKDFKKLEPSEELKKLQEVWKEKNREYQRRQYQKQKEWKKNHE